MVEALLLLVDWVDQNRIEWVRFMKEQGTTTQFAYNVSWIILAYSNAYILALEAAVEGDPGTRTPVSFHYLINELDHGRYTGRTLPRSLHDLLTVRSSRLAALESAAALPLPAPQTIVRDGRARGGGGGGCSGGGVITLEGKRRNERDGDVISNPRPSN